jgi:hypothetical protein
MEDAIAIQLAAGRSSGRAGRARGRARGARPVPKTGGPRAARPGMNGQPGEKASRAADTHWGRLGTPGWRALRAPRCWSRSWCRGEELSRHRATGRHEEPTDKERIRACAPRAGPQAAGTAFNALGSAPTAPPPHPLAHAHSARRARPHVLTTPSASSPAPSGRPLARSLGHVACSTSCSVCRAQLPLLLRSGRD